MMSWVKNNLVLVSGIVLPLLLVAGFFILSTAPRMLADPPEYDFIMIGYQYDYQHPVNYTLAFEVRDNQLEGKLIPKKDDDTHVNRQKAKIFRYRVEANSFEEIAYDLPENSESLDETVPLVLTELERIELDKRINSPDGYRFEHMGHRGRGGLLGEIFGMRRNYQTDYVLKKGSSYFELPSPTTEPYYYQNDLHFMGWIIEESDSK